MTSDMRHESGLIVKFPAISVENIGGTYAIASALAREVYGGLVVILSGGLGAGKTALVRGLAEALGVPGVKSPTFATESAHIVPGRDFDLIHADLYRFDSVPPGSETDMQFEEYLSSAGSQLLIVEWGERWSPPPCDRWDINISAPDGDSDRRSFAMSARGERAAERLSKAYEEMLDIVEGRASQC
jgi:tRNA threonylcarbamoyladenosine biosynthesis protein TsaE